MLKLPCKITPEFTFVSLLYFPGRDTSSKFPTAPVLQFQV